MLPLAAYVACIMLAASAEDMIVEDSLHLLQTSASVRIAGEVEETKDEDADEYPLQSSSKIRELTADDVVETKGEDVNEYEENAGNVSLLHLLDETAFHAVVGTMLAVAIDGYPGAIQSIASRRNQHLRDNSDQAVAAWNLTDFAIPDPSLVVTVVLKLLKAWVGKKKGDKIQIGYDVARFLWFSLRDACLLAAVMGYDMHADETLELIIRAWFGVHAGKVTAIGMGKAAHMAWETVPMVSAAADKVETLVASLLGSQVGKLAYKILLECPWYRLPWYCSTEKIKTIGEDVYSQTLDPKPTWSSLKSVLTKLRKQAYDQIVTDAPILFAKMTYNVRRMREDAQ